MNAANIDRELIERLSNEDVAAFDQLFHHYHKKLYRFAFSMLKNNDDASEIVQEVFFRIWENRFKIDSSRSFRSYLFTISHHIIIDQFRLRLKEMKYRQFLKEYFHEGSETEDEKPDFEERIQLVRDAVKELPVKRQNIYRLSREHNLSYREIAEQLGISVKTVENQINLSLKHIKSKLGDTSFLTMLFISLFV